MRRGAPAPEPRGRGLARERTALAWNRSGLAVVVCIAVLLRHLWPLRGAGPYVALGGTAAAAIVWAVTALVVSVSGADRERAPRGANVFGLMTAATVMLAIVALVLAFFGPSGRGPHGSAKAPGDAHMGPVRVRLNA